MSIESILIGGITALAGVIGFLFRLLWKHVENRVNDITELHEECEERGDVLLDQHIHLLENVYMQCGHAERCAAKNDVTGGCPVAVPLASKARETAQLLQSANRLRNELKDKREQRKAA